MSMLLFLDYYRSRAFSMPTINTMRLCVLLCLNCLSRTSLDSKVRAAQVRSSDQDFFYLNLINIQCRTYNLHNLPPSGCRTDSHCHIVNGCKRDADQIASFPLAAGGGGVRLRMRTRPDSSSSTAHSIDRWHTFANMNSVSCGWAWLLNLRRTPAHAHGTTDKRLSFAHAAASV